MRVTSGKHTGTERLEIATSALHEDCVLNAGCSNWEDGQKRSLIKTCYDPDEIKIGRQQISLENEDLVGVE